VRTLKKTLVPERAPIQVRTSHLDAYHCYLKGRFHVNKRTETGLYRGIEHFREAIALDSNFAMAYSGLGDAYTLLADYGFLLPSTAIAKAEEAARKAVELEPTLGEAVASLGLIYSLHGWQWKLAEEYYLRAIELNPGYAMAHQWFSLDCLAVQGRMDEARKHCEIACDLDPLTPLIQEGAGYLLLFERKYDAAIEHYRKILDLDPYFYKAYTSTGRALIQKGQYGQAIEWLEKGRALAGDVPNIMGALGQAHALAGNREEALHLLRALHAVTTTRYVPSTSIALLHLGLGEREEALQQLEAGCKRRDLALTSLKMHPAYDPLRGEPRFDALLRELGL
jgi:serine/threonine-protein kinase